MKNTRKLFTIVLFIVVSLQSVAFTKGILVNTKDIKFEKVLYRKSGRTNLIINSDK